MWPTETERDGHREWDRKREQGKKERAHLLSPSSLSISRTIFRVLCLSEIILSVRTLEFACDIRVAICLLPPACHLPLATCHTCHNLFASFSRFSSVAIAICERRGQREFYKNSAMHLTNCFGFSFEFGFGFSFWFGFGAAGSSDAGSCGRQGEGGRRRRGCQWVRCTRSGFGACFLVWSFI